jgi:hypothetical protein
MTVPPKDHRGFTPQFYLIVVIYCAVVLAISVGSLRVLHVSWGFYSVEGAGLTAIGWVLGKGFEPLKATKTVRVPRLNLPPVGADEQPAVPSSAVSLIAPGEMRAILKEAVQEMIRSGSIKMTARAQGHTTIFDENGLEIELTAVPEVTTQLPDIPRGITPPAGPEPPQEPASVPEPQVS